jgi:TrmH family RNA methyltransferase
LFLEPHVTETITSTHNERIKELRALRERRGRERSRLFIAEGEDMLTEALRLGLPPQAVFHDAELLHPTEPPLDLLPGDVELVPVEARALASAGSLGSGSRVIGVWRQFHADVGEIVGTPPGTAAVYLHDVADPGNVGATVRAAFGFGAAGVVLSPRAADPFAPKAVRAAMGGLFGIPVARASWEEVRAALGPAWRTAALVPGAGRPLPEAGGAGPVLFALGAERSGLPGEIAAACDELLHVPLARGGAESLNVAMTATLCLYQASIHRLSTDHG